MEPVGPDHGGLELVAGNVPHLPGVVRHELLVQRLADGGGEVIGERAAPQLGQPALDELQAFVAVLPDLALDLLPVGHLRDVLVMHRVSVFPAVGFDERKQASIDREQLVVRESHDRRVHRIFFAARPKPDVRAELIRVAAVGARPREPADLVVPLDDRDVVAFFAQVVGDRRSGHTATQDQNLVVHQFALVMRNSRRPPVTNRPKTCPPGSKVIVSSEPIVRHRPS